MHLIVRELYFKNTKHYRYNQSQSTDCWTFQNWKPFGVLIVGVPATCGERWERARWKTTNMVIEVEGRIFVQNLGGR